MAAPLKKTASWYNSLSAEEAAEITALEGIMENCRTALESASVRRQVLMRRAQAREAHRNSSLRKITQGLPRAIAETADGVRRLVATRRVRLGSRWFNRGDPYDLPRGRDIPLGFELERPPG